MNHRLPALSEKHPANASRHTAFQQRPWIGWLIISAACLLSVAPFAWWGTPSGHDFEFHMYSWMDALSQRREGILYPRWAASPHWGYGEPRFLFYPPSSWMLGAALGSLLPWKLVPAVYCWLSITLAGGAMYHLARRWLSPSDSLFAALFYALNPYHLLIVYWRSAYAELLTAALLPLLLLILLRLKEHGFRPTLQLSLLLAVAWLTNVPASVMIHYSAAGICLLLAVQDKTFRPLWKLGLAMVLGAGLAAVYLIPAFHEQHWVNIDQVFSSGVRPQDNFLFTMTSDADHDGFNRLVSYIALSEIVVLACAVRLARRKQPEAASWKILALWGGATAFATLSLSNLLWKYLPEFRFVQLPFRWLLCMNAALAILLAMATSSSAIRRWSARAPVCAALLAVVLFASQSIQPPWWATASDIDDMQQSMLDGSGNEGVDEYVPVRADAYELNKDLPRLSIERATQPDSQDADMPTATNAPANIAKMIGQKVTKWSATEKRFQVSTDNPGNLTVRLFNYPAWKVTINGRRVKTATSPVTGLMIVPIEAGNNDVEIDFTRTQDRTFGDTASVLSAAIFVLLWIRTRPRGNSLPRPLQTTTERTQS